MDFLLSPMTTDEVRVQLEPAGSGAGENMNEVFGSIEKTRARLSTPDLQIDRGFSHIGLTPMNSGDRVRSRATPASEPLKADELSMRRYWIPSHSRFVCLNSILILILYGLY